MGRVGLQRQQYPTPISWSLGGNQLLFFVVGGGLEQVRAGWVLQLGCYTAQLTAGCWELAPDGSWLLTM